MSAMILALATSAATFVGGSLPLHTRLKRLESRYLIGFAAGAMVTIALTDLIAAAPGSGLFWDVTLGFFGMYLLEKLIMIHACGEAECEAHPVGWPILIGIAAESLIDGVAIATSFAVSPSLGLGVALAVFAHELPRGMMTAVIMRRAGYGLLPIWGALLVDGGFTPLGALFGAAIPSSALGVILRLTAGAFLYVGASDLLPDAHRRFNLRVVLATLSGAGLIALLGQLM